MRPILAGLILTVGVFWPEPVLSNDTRQTLDALKAVRSVTTLGIAYRDYGQRLADAKIVVDRYLERKDQPAVTQAMVSRALRYYEAAYVIWGSQLRLEGRDKDKIPLAAFDHLSETERDCPALNTLTAKVLDEYANVPKDQRRSVIVGPDVGAAGTLIPVLWSCASMAIGEAQKVPRGKGK
jgi:hypothetical protein